MHYSCSPRRRRCITLQLRRLILLRYQLILLLQ
jgi:hypothetical protein